MNRSRGDQILAEWDYVSRRARRPALRPQTLVSTSLRGMPLVGIAIAGITVAVAAVFLRVPPDDLPGARPDSTPPVVIPSTAGSPNGSFSTTEDWGPLAVVPPSNLVMEALITGTLRITDTCVLLDEPRGDPVLLVWPADRTAWNAADRAITLENLDGSGVTFHDGEQLRLGGGGDSTGEGGAAGQEWVIQTEWVSPPAASCPLDTRWYVGQVDR